MHAIGVVRTFHSSPIKMTRTTAAQLVDLYRRRDHQDLLVSAHRGYRWSGVPENSRESVIRAAREGLTSVEIDLRVTSDGVVVCVHDNELGRVTTIAEHLGRADVYDPLTGQGYNPRVDSLPWKGCLEHVSIKDEHGNVSAEGIMTLSDLIDTVEQNRLGILVLMDFKGAESIEASYHVLKDRSNAFGEHALDWCIFKPDACFMPSPDDLEATAWHQEATKNHLQTLWIPVFDIVAGHTLNTLALAKAWSSRSYVISLELGLRSPGGTLQPVVDWATGPNGPNIGIGFFAALGDVRKGNKGYTIPWAGGEEQRLAYDTNIPPTPYETFLTEGDASDGKDHRADIDLFRQMGYSWVIADPAPETLALYEAQKAYAAGRDPQPSARL